MFTRLAVLSALVLAPVLGQASDPFSLSGTVVNTTNPAKPLTAPATISIDAEGTCVLRVGPPLYGSGSCEVRDFSKEEGNLTIHSIGPNEEISCSGKLTDTGYQGTYIVEFPNFPEPSQQGTFSLTFDEKPDTLQLASVVGKFDFTTDSKEFHVPPTLCST